MQSTQSEGTPFSWEQTPIPPPVQPMHMPASTPTPTPAPASTPGYENSSTPAPAGRASRSKITLMEEDRLVLARLCVEHQSKHRRGNKENFWKEIKELFFNARGKRLSDPRDTMTTLLIQLEVNDRQEARESGTVQNDSDLKQVLRLWKDHIDAMVQDTAGKKKAKEELEADQEAANQRRNNLLLTRSQKRKNIRPVNLDSSDDESSSTGGTASSSGGVGKRRKKSAGELDLLVTTITDMRKDSKKMIESFGETAKAVNESLRALVTVASLSQSIAHSDTTSTPSRLDTLENEMRTQTSTIKRILAMLQDMRQQASTVRSSNIHTQQEPEPVDSQTDSEVSRHQKASVPTDDDNLA